MKNHIKYLAIIITSLVLSANLVHSQKPNGNFGFGLVLGDPSGLTGKFWLGNSDAVNIAVGSSYFGKLRVGVDYQWHFDAFRSNQWNLFGAAGGVLGLGEGNDYVRKKYFEDDEDLGLGARGVFGVNFIPKGGNFEIFAEAGLLVGFVPEFGSGFDFGIGARFYP